MDKAYGLDAHYLLERKKWKHATISICDRLKLMENEARPVEKEPHTEILKLSQFSPYHRLMLFNSLFCSLSGTMT